MEATRSFFFNLNRKPRTSTGMLYLQDTDGHVTTGPKEMKKMATDFYKELYQATGCDSSCVHPVLRS